MWLVPISIGVLLMTALTCAAWYSLSVLIGGPAFDAAKLPAIMCGWLVLLSGGFWGIVAYEEFR